MLSRPGVVGRRREMMRWLGRAIPVSLFASILAAGVVGAGGKGKKLDNGLLDPSWFGPNVEFRTTENIDYVWAKPGFSIKGRKLLITSGPIPSFSVRSATPRTLPRRP